MVSIGAAALRASLTRVRGIGGGERKQAGARLANREKRTHSLVSPRHRRLSWVEPGLWTGLLSAHHSNRSRGAVPPPARASRWFSFLRPIRRRPHSRLGN